MHPAPRVIVVEPDQWPRAIMRAALIEAGYDAIGSRGLAASLRIPAADPVRGSVVAVVVDNDALAAASIDVGRSFRQRFRGAAMVLIARPTRAAARGSWAAVLKRPASVADVVDAVRRVAPLA